LPLLRSEPSGQMPDACPCGVGARPRKEVPPRMSHYQRTTSPLALLVSLALAGLLAIAGAGFAAPALAATSGATASSTPARAPSSFESTLFGWINRDRVDPAEESAFKRARRDRKSTRLKSSHQI